MTDILNNATNLRPQGERKIDAPLIKLDLPFFIDEIKNEKTWHDGDRNAITLLKNKLMRIVLMALRKGATLKKHQAAGAISIHVLEGKMIFITDAQSIELVRGEMITLHEGIAHSVVAKEETVFLLTIATAHN
jgi:quercetin dioxygenase-like cupin family protein